MAEIQVDSKLVEAFHLMYDSFPEAVQLAHKSKLVVAVNPACKAAGREVGMICAQHGPAEAHKGCLAAKAVKEQKPSWIKGGLAAGPNSDAVTFWLHVPQHPDYFIHFAVGFMKDYHQPPE